MSIEIPDVRAWVGVAPGEFTFADAAKFFLRGKQDSQADAMDLMMCLEGMVEYSELERVGSRRGHYRTQRTELVKMDIANACSDGLPIWLPFGMHRLVKLMGGNIVTIGGEKNAGKSALSLHIAHDNADKFKVHYFNSEMGAGELKLRLDLFCHANRCGMSGWKNVDFYERSDNFSDVIFPGEGHISIVDFYECHSDFYAMGEGIRQIHDKLDGGVCFINIQKNPGSDDPLGGRRVTEKSRLHLSLGYNYGNSYPHRLKIEVGKNWADPETNPRGMFVDFRLAQGCYLKPDDTRNPPHIWQREKS